MIDDKLIDAHQWVIDETQKKPGWWAEQAIMAATALDLVRQVLKWEGGWDAVVVLILLVVSALLVHACKNPAFLKTFGEAKYIRCFFMGMIAYRIYMMFTQPETGIYLLECFSSIFMLSFYYFAACNDPKPPKRKEKLVPKFA